MQPIVVVLKRSSRKAAEVAVRVFAVYGEEEAFRKILDQYGHQVIPIVASFVEDGSPELQYRQALDYAKVMLQSGETSPIALAILSRLPATRRPFGAGRD